jgi:rRNA maturation RNase YbeY
MIVIKNKQRKIQIDTDALEQEAQKILAIVRYGTYDLGILLTNDKLMRTYNREYRNKDCATDILSFPFYPELQAGERIKAKTEDEKNLGDLIISLESVQSDAKKFGVSFEQRLKKILVHGICHLLGYDHIKDADWRRMRAKEAFILKQLT